MPGIFDLLTPVNANDGYAITDPTFQIGGFREVQSVSDRDAISLERRRTGMFVYVLNEDKIYTLKGGIDNFSWIESLSNISPSLVSNINTDIGTLNALDSGLNSILKLKNANSVNGICPRRDGDLLFIYNISNNDMLVKNQCSQTDEDKRIITSLNSDLILKSFSVILVSYDISIEKWKVLFYDRDVREFNKDVFSYSIYSFGEIKDSKSIDLTNIDFGGAVLYHKNTNASTIKLLNGIPGKSYKIFTVSNGVSFSFISNNKIVWKDGVVPVISQNAKIDIFYFECITSDTFLGYYSNNYSAEEIESNSIYSPVEPTIWSAV